MSPQANNEEGQSLDEQEESEVPEYREDKVNVKVSDEVACEEEFSVKTLHNSDISGARKNVKDIKVVGDGDLFKLLSKASSEKEGWMKSTKAMYVVHGCVVQVTTQQRNKDGSYAIAEATCYVPGVKITSDIDGGRKLISR
jgi:hypothetical protein